MLLFVLEMPTLTTMPILKWTILLKGGSNARKNTLPRRHAPMLSSLLLGHVHPDTLILEPSSCEGHHASHVVALSGEVGREEVHLQDFFVKAGVEDLDVVLIVTTEQVGKGKSSSIPGTRHSEIDLVGVSVWR